MFWLHFKYINACWLFAFMLALSYVFCKCTGRAFPMSWEELKDCYNEIKADVYGGS